MAATLMFYPRHALLEATAAGQTFQLRILQDHARISAWEHMFELRPGKQTLWDHTFEVPGTTTGRNGTINNPLATRAVANDEGRRAAFHSYPGPTLYLGTPERGVHIHGWPPCNLTTCIVVLQQWDRLQLAIAGERSLRFCVRA
ncbi:MAG TPA: hypothetical protein VKB50_15635 [Vicinamibacterales bacterium]|nr:hypothetical protein [Vicinamibacterales bacterium]